MLVLLKTDFLKFPLELVMGGNLYEEAGYLPAGTYEFTASKKNHVTRTYIVTVGNSVLVQDAKICLIGDVTGDGKVNIADTSKVYAHVKGTGELTGYAFACGDVDGNGKINVADTSKVYSHVKGTKLLY